MVKVKINIEKAPYLEVDTRYYALIGKTLEVVKTEIPDLYMYQNRMFFRKDELIFI